MAEMESLTDGRFNTCGEDAKSTNNNGAEVIPADDCHEPPELLSQELVRYWFVSRGAASFEVGRGRCGCGGIGAGDEEVDSSILGEYGVDVEEGMEEDEDDGSWLDGVDMDLMGGSGLTGDGLSDVDREGLYEVVTMLSSVDVLSACGSTSTGLACISPRIAECIYCLNNYY